MSAEQPASTLGVRKIESVRSVDLEAAKELVKESPLLSKDSRTQEMLSADFFITIEGKEMPVDPGDWIHARLAILSNDESSPEALRIKLQNPTVWDHAMAVESTDRIVYH